MCGILLLVEAGAQGHHQAQLVRMICADPTFFSCAASLVRRHILLTRAPHFLIQAERFAAGLRARGPDHFGAVQVRLLLLLL
jgi:hypothetical protein